MYHLTCPSCQDKTESPFVRNGAVVRCGACDHKYRIKSAHFEREILTGPRTLGETDTVLRSDSVDIDPDEVGPVSIDDDGNVVGLSGLSELMRWSDEQTSVQPSGPSKPPPPSGDAGQHDADLPQARAGKSRAKTRAKPKPDAAGSSASSGRARARAIKREKRNKMYIFLAGTGVIVIAVLVIIVFSLSGGSSNNESGTENSTAGTTGTDAVDSTPSDPTPNKPNDPPADHAQPKPPDDVLVFSDSYQPSPNPEPKFDPPWRATGALGVPTDVPTVLTPSTELTHEGWYVSSPPRGPASAAGDSSIELNQVTAASQPDGTTLLTGSVTNNSTKALVGGELHIMLLDSTGNVFAETFTPLAMIGASKQQGIALSIPTRYWKRSRGVRASVEVTTWADEMKPLQGVLLAPNGRGQASSLRLSVRHLGEKPLRNVAILLNANNSEGELIASFLVKEQNLFVAKEHWLDLVISTPLPTGQQASTWSATVLQQ